MSSIASVASAAADLSASFGGQLLKPTDEGYEEARKVHNGLVDKRPALIARCRSVADVVDAVALATKLGLEVAVRGGGHNVAGRATIDGGIMIDLSPMKGVYRQNRTGAGRGHLGRGQSGDATSRTCGHRRRGLDHGDCRTNPRRRTGLADGQVRPSTG